MMNEKLVPSKRAAEVEEVQHRKVRAEAAKAAEAQGGAEADEVQHA